jgi:hypothetical protein
MLIHTTIRAAITIITRTITGVTRRPGTDPGCNCRGHIGRKRLNIGAGAMIVTGTDTMIETGTGMMIETITGMMIVAGDSSNYYGR